MDTDSQTAPAYARVNCSKIMQGLASCGQTPLATALGVDQSTIQRFASGESKINAESVARMLAEMGLQLVPVDAVMVDRDEYRDLLKRARNDIDAKLAAIGSDAEISGSFLGPKP